MLVSSNLGHYRLSLSTAAPITIRLTRCFSPARGLKVLATQFLRVAGHGRDRHEIDIREQDLEISPVIRNRLVADADPAPVCLPGRRQPVGEIGLPKRGPEHGGAVPEVFHTGGVDLYPITVAGRNQPGRAVNPDAHA